MTDPVKPVVLEVFVRLEFDGSPKAGVQAAGKDRAKVAGKPQ